MEQTRTNKKTIAIVAAVACLALAAALGTYAELIDQYVYGWKHQYTR